jgi:5-methylcytosine-specific restriction endonuclease McrA
MQLRRELRQDGATCYMCHRKLAIEEITLDHVRPRSRGGDESDDNLKVACEPCNNRKGGRLPEECEWPKL